MTKPDSASNYNPTIVSSLSDILPTIRNEPHVSIVFYTTHEKNFWFIFSLDNGDIYALYVENFDFGKTLSDLVLSLKKHNQTYEMSAGVGPVPDPPPPPEPTQNPSVRIS